MSALSFQGPILYDATACLHRSNGFLEIGLPLHRNLSIVHHLSIVAEVNDLRSKKGCQIGSVRPSGIDAL